MFFSLYSTPHTHPAGNVAMKTAVVFTTAAIAFDTFRGRLVTRISYYNKNMYIGTINLHKNVRLCQESQTRDLKFSAVRSHETIGIDSHEYYSVLRLSKHKISRNSYIINIINHYPLLLLFMFMV